MSAPAALAEMNEMTASLRSRQMPVGRAVILQRAAQDYDPALAAVEAPAIRALRWPKEAGHMLVDLRGPMNQLPGAALSFLLALGSINYRFWSLAPNGEFSRYRFMGRTGAKALWSAMEAAWGDSVFSGPLRQRLTGEGFAALFGDMPDPESRLVILHQLLDREQVDHCAQELATRIEREGAVRVEHAQWLAERFPAAFAEPYLKKAQLALSMFAGYRWGRGEPCAVTDLTAFADYQVPRVLRALGVLRYGDALAAQIDAGRPLAIGSADERAIRSATIRACEEIGLHGGWCAADVDNLLWQSQDVAGESRFHLTETTAY